MHLGTAADALQRPASRWEAIDPPVTVQLRLTLTEPKARYHAPPLWVTADRSAPVSVDPKTMNARRRAAPLRGWTSCTMYHRAVDTADWWKMFNTRSGVVAQSLFVGTMCGVFAWLATINPIVGFAITGGCGALVSTQLHHYSNHTNLARSLYPDGCVTSKFGGWKVLTVGHVKRSHEHCHYRGWA